MRVIKQILLLKLFSEDNDQGEGPLWAKGCLVFSGVLIVIGIGLSMASLLFGRPNDASHGIFLAAAANAIMSGGAWHLKMPGRAKNGLLLAAVLMFVGYAFKLSV